MLALDDARRSVGSRVRCEQVGEDPPELGTITGVGSFFVFVRYDGDDSGIPTPPELLELVQPTASV